MRKTICDFCRREIRISENYVSCGVTVSVAVRGKRFKLSIAPLDAAGKIPDFDICRECLYKALALISIRRNTTKEESTCKSSI